MCVGVVFFIIAEYTQEALWNPRTCEQKSFWSETGTAAVPFVASRSMLHVSERK